MAGLANVSLFFVFCLFLLLSVRSCTVAACASQLLRAYLLAYFAYHAIAWYVVHAVGRGHGGENIAAAVGVFLPKPCSLGLRSSAAFLRWVVCVSVAVTSACKCLAVFGPV